MSVILHLGDLVQEFKFPCAIISMIKMTWEGKGGEEEEAETLPRCLYPDMFIPFSSAMFHVIQDDASRRLTLISELLTYEAISESCPNLSRGSQSR